MLVQLRETVQSSGGSTPTTSSLIILSQTLDQYSLLVWKVSYTTAELALAGELESVFCNDLNITMNSNRVMIERKPDITAVMRSGNILFLFLVHRVILTLACLQISVSVEMCR